MAQTGYTPISLYYSTTASAAPTAGNLVNGELAINITDKKLYAKDNAGNVFVIADASSGGTTATNLAGGAAGSLPYQTGAGATTFRSIGTALQVLQVNAGATAPEWVSSTGTGNVVRATSPTLATPTITTSATVPLLIGGTGTTSTLTLRSTSGVGTTGADIIFQTGNNGATEAMRILNSGDVGIGTGSPTAKVDIQGTGAVALLCNQRTDTTSISTPLMFKTAGNNYWALRQSSAALTFYQDTAIGGTATEYMRIDSAGNLGVGTNNPTEFVYISKSQDAVTRTRTDNSSTGTAAQAQFSLRNSAASLASFGLTGGSFTTSGIFRQDGAYLTTGGAGGLTLGTQAAQPIYFATNSAERMRIDSAGNVGIGTASPGTRLDIANTGAGTKGGEVIIRNSSARQTGNYAQLAFAPNADYTGSVVGAFIQGLAPNANANNPCDLVFGSGLGGAPTERMRIDSNGSVGIGNASPGSVVPAALVIDQVNSRTGIAIRCTATTGTDNSTEVRMFGYDGAAITVIGQLTAADSAHATLANSVILRANRATGYLRFDTGGSNERMRISAAGVVGVGTSAPSAWAEKAIDLGSYGSVYGGGANFGAASNLYYNGANWIYKNTAAGSVLNLSSGGMLVYTAASGTAGATATLTQALTLTSASNLKIGGSAERATTVGTNHLDIFNGTAPVGTLTNGISIYSSSGEAYVMDAAGNATLFSPHDAETNEWIFKSKHTPTGKVLKIDVEKMLRFINDHFGLDAIHEFTE